MSQRGEHEIEDELLFSNHRGYVFHDSRGIECGGIEELQILWRFIQSKASENRLRSRLHAIWFGLLCAKRRLVMVTYFQVLHPDGQPTTSARAETF